MDSILKENTPEGRLETIFFIMNQRTFSRTEASIIVGGKGRLHRLCEQGKIRFDKPTAKQNGKWFCNAADVLKHATIKI